MSELKCDESVKVLSVDKGNATVILNGIIYKIKTSHNFNSGKYTLLLKYSINTYEIKITTSLRKYMK